MSLGKMYLGLTGLALNVNNMFKRMKVELPHFQAVTYCGLNIKKFPVMNLFRIAGLHHRTMNSLM